MLFLGLDESYCGGTFSSLLSTKGL